MSTAQYLIGINSAWAYNSYSTFADLTEKDLVRENFSDEKQTFSRADGTTYQSYTFYVTGYKHVKGYIRFEWDVDYSVFEDPNKYTYFKIKYQKQSGDDWNNIRDIPLSTRAFNFKLDADKAYKANICLTNETQVTNYYFPGGSSTDWEGDYTDPVNFYDVHDSTERWLHSSTDYKKCISGPPVIEAEVFDTYVNLVITNLAYCESVYIFQKVKKYVDVSSSAFKATDESSVYWEYVHDTNWFYSKNNEYTYVTELHADQDVTYCAFCTYNPYEEKDINGMSVARFSEQSVPVTVRATIGTPTMYVESSTMDVSKCAHNVVWYGYPTNNNNITKCYFDTLYYFSDDVDNSGITLDPNGTQYDLEK